MTEPQLTPKLAELPILDEDAVDDARARSADRHWAELGRLFDRYAKEQGLTYAALAKRIGRSRSQVQRWLSAPHNMTFSSAGLLAEGLNADVVVQITPRLPQDWKCNYAHPCVRAAEDAALHMIYSKPLRVDPTLSAIATTPSTAPSSGGDMRTSFTTEKDKTSSSAAAAHAF